ncbi:TPA: hypothetical protein ACR6K7_006394 [Pseudomonas aeruginosa]|uniref:hypothetical protein n=1 Tax=Pseudomonas aeruginosa TaxID=287 RepID=UPI00053D023E|nr:MULTISPECIES: hypothetical protein [Pseudomonadaceae]KJS79064.1 MAG: hypothetical protein JL55_13675 [[Pseudomonas] sp. BICA1-14]HBP0221331.1 hypothetical protein [Pseudomonas aeruginosa]HBP0254499.1 hypothetical protein [Pseudomonas aeruginosa]HBP0468483.1 hypothetical protein [Pseudomonas aeruginosa]
MGKFATYVIQLPSAQASRSEITQGIRTLVEEHGGTITGQSAEDEMTLAEMFEKRLDDFEVQEARAEAAALIKA